MRKIGYWLLALLLLGGCSDPEGSINVTSEAVQDAAIFRVDAYSDQPGPKPVEGRSFLNGETMSLEGVPEGQWSVLVQAQNSDGTTISHFRGTAVVEADRTVSVHAGPYSPGLPGDVSSSSLRLDSFGAQDQATFFTFFGPENNASQSVSASVTINRGENSAALARTYHDESETVYRCLPADHLHQEVTSVQEAMSRGLVPLPRNGIVNRFQQVALGDTLDFFIVTTSQTATCQKVLPESSTEHCTIFAEVVNGNPVLDTNTAQAIANAFDSANPYRPGSGIYDRVREVFGNEWEANGGRDGDSKICFVFLSSGTIGGNGLFGFFRPSDQLSTADVPNSNEGEILYLNADRVTGDLFDILATIAHEFQHLINYNQRVAQDGAFPTGAVAEATTINEGLSVLCEELNGFTLTETGGGNNFLYRSVEGFLSQPEEPFFVFTNRLRDYGAGYLWMRYLHDRLGVDAVTAFATSSSSGKIAFEATTDLEFEAFFRDWVQALLVSDLVDAPATLLFSDLSLVGTFTIRELGSVTLPGLTVSDLRQASDAATASFNLDPWTPTFIRFNNGNDGALELQFQAAGVDLTTSLVHESPAGTFSSLQP